MAEAKQTMGPESISFAVVPRDQLEAHMQNLIGEPAGSTVHGRLSPLDDLQLQWAAYGRRILNKIDSAAERAKIGHEVQEDRRLSQVVERAALAEHGTASPPEEAEFKRKPFLDVAVITTRERSILENGKPVVGKDDKPLVDKTVEISGAAAVYIVGNKGATHERLDGILAFNRGLLDPATLRISNENPGISILPADQVVSSLDGATHLPVESLVMGAMGKDRIVVPVPTDLDRLFYNSEAKKFQPTRPTTAAKGPAPGVGG